jgi:hypothetical protein
LLLTLLQLLLLLPLLTLLLVVGDPHPHVLLTLLLVSAAGQ